MLTRIYSPRRSEDGFTLIELLIVVIIIGILAAIALPIFLNQQKAAVDSSVQSDVRNTTENVQTWMVSHGTTAVSSTGAYTTAGGKVVQSGTNTIDITADGKGAYTVCGYTGKGNQFTSNNAAFVYDSTTGKFTSSATGCPGDALPGISTASIPDGNVGDAYNVTINATGSPAPTFSATGLPAGLSINSGSGVISGTPTTTGSYTVTVTANNGTSVSKTYAITIHQWVDCAAENNTCSFTGTTTVRYGYAPTSTWTYKTLTNGTSCSNGVFGDPDVGYYKECYYLQ